MMMCARLLDLSGVPDQRPRVTSASMCTTPSRRWPHFRQEIAAIAVKRFM
jgi:hypothetical protein